METGKNGFASGFVLENKGQGEAWVHKRQCRTLTAEGPDHYLCAVRPTSIYPVTPNFLLLIRTLISAVYLLFCDDLSTTLSKDGSQAPR